MLVHVYIVCFFQIYKKISEKILPRSFSVTFQTEVWLRCLVCNVSAYITTYIVSYAKILQS